MNFLHLVAVIIMHKYKVYEIKNMNYKIIDLILIFIINLGYDNIDLNFTKNKQ